MASKHPWLLSACFSAFCFLFTHVSWADTSGWTTEKVEQQKSPDQIESASAELLELLNQGLTNNRAATFAEIADWFGTLVNKAREDGNFPTKGIDRLALDAEQFLIVCRKKIRQSEAEAGENEAALERLYRSDDWYQLNYALAAFRYWHAWLDLTRANRYYLSDNQSEKSLFKAERGFKSSAMRILYPGIVYGSWLGLAYVDLARDQQEDAQNKLEMLETVISGDSSNPLNQIVKQELALLAVKQGEISPFHDDGQGNLADSDRAIIFAESLLLLEQHRQKSVGAIEAAKRIRRLLSTGTLSERQVQQLMAYREEIVGQDLGVLSRLIEAEYAYDYKQYNTVIIKYRSFKKQQGESLDLDLTLYRYHYAVALDQVALPKKSLAVIHDLQATKTLSNEWLAPLSHLHFVVAQRLFEQTPTTESAAELNKAAKGYLLQNPEGKDIGLALLALGEVTKDTKQARSYLNRAAKLPGLKREANLLQLDLLRNQLNTALRGDDLSEPAIIAAKMQPYFSGLTGKQRRQPEVAALSLQLQVILREALPTAVKKIDRLAARKDLKIPVKQVLLWSKLRALNTCPDQCPSLLNFVKEILAAPLQLWQQEEIFRFLLDKEKADNRPYIIEISNLVYPKLNNQPEIQRQLLLLKIRTFEKDGEYDKAFNVTKSMINSFPESGDGWLAYAQLAEKAGRFFQAERGWAKIVASSAEGSPKWLQGMLKQLTLKTEESVASDVSGNNQVASNQVARCEKANQVKVYEHLLTEKMKDQFVQQIQRLGCAN